MAACPSYLNDVGMNGMVSRSSFISLNIHSFSAFLPYGIYNIQNNIQLYTKIMKRIFAPAVRSDVSNSTHPLKDLKQLWVRTDLLYNVIDRNLYSYYLIGLYRQTKGKILSQNRTIVKNSHYPLNCKTTKF